MHDTVVVGVRNRAVGLDTLTGTERWKVEYSGTPLGTDHRIYLSKPGNLVLVTPLDFSDVEGESSPRPDAPDSAQRIDLDAGPVELPHRCAAAAFDQGEGPYDLSTMIDGGQVDTLDSEATSYNGDPIVVQAIACKGQSDELSLVAYDISGSMLGSFDFSDLPDINLGSAERLTISSVTGSYVDVVLLDDEAMKESEFHFFFDGETFRIL